MNIGVFYIATSIYKEYFYKYFLPSMKNLFPNEQKKLILISDGLNEYDNEYIDNYNIYVEHIINFPYPIINLTKFQLVEFYAKKYGIDTILYFDADTIIFKKNNEFWENLKTKLLNANNLIFSYHPNYLYNNSFNFEQGLFFPFNEVDNDIVNQFKIDYNDFRNHKSYIMTSFFMGKYKYIKEYAEKIYNYAKIGLSTYYLRCIPFFSDETYLNIINHKEGYKLLLDKYITINPYTYYSEDYEERNINNIWKNNFPEYESIFINQKFNINLKNIIR